MPPRIKVTKIDIIQTALKLCRENGAEAINARSIAAAIGCSTQPIFSNFETMEELKSATIYAAYELYLKFIQNESALGKYPTYKAFGMAYVRFAKEERELFKLLFMRDRTGEDLSPPPDFEESASLIAAANGISIEKSRLMHLEMWSCVHGIGVMIATSFLPLNDELISNMLSDVYQGLRQRHTEEGEQ